MPHKRQIDKRQDRNYNNSTFGIEKVGAIWIQFPLFCRKRQANRQKERGIV